MNDNCQLLVLSIKLLSRQMVGVINDDVYSTMATADQTEAKMAASIAVKERVV